MAGPKLMLDADILITLAQHPDNLPAVGAIKDAIRSQNPWSELVLSDCVKTAYEREKERAAKSFWATQRTTIKSLRNLGVALSDKNNIDAVADELSQRVGELEKTVPTTRTAVDELVALARVVLSTPTMWAEAARRFREDLPPAGRRLQKSCITDCILWQTVVQESRTSAVTFCTNNKHDFSDPKHDEKLDPALIQELGEAKYCYHSLAGFQKAHLRSVEVVVGPVFDPAERCFYCGFETDAGLVARPSQFGGWSYQRFCRNCGKFSDTGEPYDD